MDMTPFVAAKSDQLNSDDLSTGPRTVKITGVRGVDGDQPVAISYEGDGGKPYKPCKTCRRVMVAVWGKYADKYVGQSMTLYCDPTVTFGGMQVGGIRISHMSGLTAKKTIALNTTRGKKGLYTVQPLQDAPQQQETADYAAELEQLKALARPGNLSVLQAKWQDIGAPARKALSGYLQELKDECAVRQPGPDPDDVAFDSQPTGGDYDGA